MSASLVGSEMCIRDRALPWPARRNRETTARPTSSPPSSSRTWDARSEACLLYTSDAADDM
eukprot:13282132-Alexandrium_andersonii.AAC.1